MENFYLQEFIEEIEHELDEHKKQRSTGLDVHQAVRGDEFEEAQHLDKLASELEAKGKTKEAAETRMQAEEMVAQQLNEFDGDAR